ncbi:type II toxin-antitoxin system Phd/YefM family antitoxin [Gordonia sp. SL306]|uniref:type II toxin-antitoxin system Phd/YefM family antitoxin n=1 Tax=Gordonia sp. SL306 TaxID=2995145 RepID=UPI00226E1AEB|nr:type II toxin-antitoxin system Phd/YefM family antitoxin [Gordonia sp. SL306]WAC57848.1 type II toxin-antitoxin system Phd/YefM family antitoxin [Gordonia sp. SL306]
MRVITSTEAKARLNALLAEVEQSGASITITNHGRPVATLSPVETQPRTFGRLPKLVVPETLDDPLPDSDLSEWEGGR